MNWSANRQARSRTGAWAHAARVVFFGLGLTHGIDVP
jgi:hypothetical protein